MSGAVDLAKPLFAKPVDRLVERIDCFADRPSISLRRYE